MYTLEKRTQIYSDLYTKISKATIEVKDANGNFVKPVITKNADELFEEIAQQVTSKVLTRFMWAISHKTDALPTVLFNIRRSKHGFVIQRAHSGFYNDKREHIVGTALVPFIMEAMRQYKPQYSRTKPAVPAEETSAIDRGPFPYVHDMNDDELTALAAAVDAEFRSRAERREKQAKLQQVLELAEMSRDELKELLSI